MSGIRSNEKQKNAVKADWAQNCQLPGKIQSAEEFRSAVWDFSQKYRRDFPWRQTRDPFAIFVSEIMLQQTQTQRVEPKYLEFLRHFSSFSDLAKASLQDVLALWSGLGYNRRAKFLLQSARHISDVWNGILPDDAHALLQLPGVGPNTAGSLCAFIFNTPVVFIETNIRRVFLHYWFPQQHDVPDSEILSLVESNLDYENPREWYYALMDLGVALKKQTGNANTRSAAYVRQSPFEGSDRQLRGRILRMLQQQTEINSSKLFTESGFPEYRIEKVIQALVSEEFIEYTPQGSIRLRS